MGFPWTHLGCWRHGIFELDRRLKAQAGDRAPSADGLPDAATPPATGTPATSVVAPLT